MTIRIYNMCESENIPQRSPEAWSNLKSAILTAASMCTHTHTQKNCLPWSNWFSFKEFSAIAYSCLHQLFHLHWRQVKPSGLCRAWNITWNTTRLNPSSKSLHDYLVWFSSKHHCAYGEVFHNLPCLLLLSIQEHKHPKEMFSWLRWLIWNTLHN